MQHFLFGYFKTHSVDLRPGFKDSQFHPSDLVRTDLLLTTKNVVVLVIGHCLMCCTLTSSKVRRLEGHKSPQPLLMHFKIFRVS